MKEILACEVWTGNIIKAVIDRETGEFTLFHSRFRLDIQENKAALMDYNSGEPIFKGYVRGNCWFFEELEYCRESADPYVAAIQMLYDILQYC
jgi:hypothetical protein